MKPLRAWGRLTQILAALMVLVCGSAPSSPIGAPPFPSASTPSGARAQELSSGGQTWLRAAITSGNFADLRWPDFNDYSKHVQKFYELNRNSLSWVRGMEPTPQAREVIALLLQAEQKGLSADDYDGS